MRNGGGREKWGLDTDAKRERQERESESWRNNKEREGE